MIRLQIHVKPGSRENAIYRDQLGLVQVRLKARPEKGEANAALVKFLSAYFGVRQNQINIQKGNKGRNKTLLLPLTEEALEGIESRV